MRKIGILLLLILCLFQFISCEKESRREGDIRIEMESEKYTVNEPIPISITNELDITAFHYKCDNYDLTASHFSKRILDNWKEQGIYHICTAQFPSGFWGEIAPSETKVDLIRIKASGIYTLKYTFIIDSDTSYYSSNNFEVINN